MSRWQYVESAFLNQFMDKFIKYMYSLSSPKWGPLKVMKEEWNKTTFLIKPKILPIHDLYSLIKRKKKYTTLQLPLSI